MLLKEPLHGYGQSVTGHVLDCNKKALEQAMRRYDSQLYLVWNAEKNAGAGTWELRRKPNAKIPVLQYQWKGTNLYELQYVENEFEHHVKDFQYLNNSILSWLKEHDMWEHRDRFIALDSIGDSYRASVEAKVKAEQKYLIKHEMKYFRQLKDTSKDGFNPFSLFKGVKG